MGKGEKETNERNEEERKKVGLKISLKKKKKKKKTSFFRGMSAPSTATGISSATFQSVFGTLPSLMITQLGYPVVFENGNTLQISVARRSGTTSLERRRRGADNAEPDERLCGDRRSRGGPWIVNYGSDAKSMATGTNYGAFATRDVVVGVTSWGFSSGDVKTSATTVLGRT